MRTVDMIVGKEYLINGVKCRCDYNGVGIKCTILEGDLIGYELTAIHGQKLKITEL